MYLIPRDNLGISYFCDDSAFTTITDITSVPSDPPIFEAPRRSAWKVCAAESVFPTFTCRMLALIPC